MENFEGKITKYELSDDLLQLITGVYKDTNDIDQIKSFQNTIEIDTETDKFQLDNFDVDIDVLLLFKNGTYNEYGSDYIFETSEDDSKLLFVKSNTGTWKKGTIISYIVFKNSKKFIQKIQYTTSSATNAIPISFKKFDMNKDDMIIFQNSILLDNEIYKTNDKYIINSSKDWDNGTTFNFIEFKNSKPKNRLQKLYIELIGDNDNFTVEGLSNYNKNKDVLLLFQNTIFVNPNEYEVRDNKIFSSDQTQWKDKTKFTVIIFKNPGSITMDQSQYILDEAADEVPLTLQYNKDNDSLLLFQNTIYTTDYSIEKDKIKSLQNKQWKKGTIFDFINFKNCKDKVIKSSTTLKDASNRVTIGSNIKDYSDDDVVLVFLDSTFYSSTSKEYSIVYYKEQNKLDMVSNNVIWKANSKFDFIIIKSLKDSAYINSFISKDSGSYINNIFGETDDNFDPIKDKIIIFKNGVFINSSRYNIYKNNIYFDDIVINENDIVDYIILKNGKSNIDKVFKHKITRSDLSDELIEELEECKKDRARQNELILDLTKRIEILEDKNKTLERTMKRM